MSEWNKTMQNDLAKRSPEINWPSGYEPEKADLFAHNELLIHGSAQKIWKLLVEATKWPQWYPNSEKITLLAGGEVLQPDTVFHWSSFGLPLESTVNEFVPEQRLSWFGGAPAATPAFYHTWYIIPQSETECLVVTEEVGVGADAAGFREHNEGLLHRGHDLWLATLKWMAENDL